MTQDTPEGLTVKQIEGWRKSLLERYEGPYQWAVHCRTELNALCDMALRARPGEPVIEFYEWEWKGEHYKNYRWLVAPDFPAGTKCYLALPDFAAGRLAGLEEAAKVCEQRSVPTTGFLTATNIEAALCCIAIRAKAQP